MWPAGRVDLEVQEYPTLWARVVLLQGAAAAAAERGLKDSKDLLTQHLSPPFLLPQTCSFPLGNYVS